MKKTVLLSAAAALLICFAGCGQQQQKTAAAGYGDLGKSDFKVTLDVPKTELKVGQSETVTARFYNNSGKTLPIANSGQELNVFVKEKSESTDNDIYWTLMRSGGYMQSGAYVEKTYEFKPQKAGTYVAKAGGQASIITNGDEVGVNDSSNGQIKNVEAYADEVIIEVAD